MNNVKQIKTYSVVSLIIGVIASVFLSIEDLSLVIRSLLVDKTLYIVNLKRGLIYFLAILIPSVLCFFLCRIFARKLQTALENDTFASAANPNKITVDKVFDLLGKVVAVAVAVVWWLWTISIRGTDSTTRYLFYLIVLIVPMAISMWMSKCILAGVGDYLACASRKKQALSDTAA